MDKPLDIEAERVRALGLYKAPFKFIHGYIQDANSQTVADNDGGEAEPLRIRGWGRISYLPNPEVLKDTVGAMIAEALTNYWLAAKRGIASQAQSDLHADEIAVDRFAIAMKAKMAESRAKGRGGWDDPAQCAVEKLAAMLCEHVEKGDPVDIANFAMMVHQRGGCAIDVYEALAVFLNARAMGELVASQAAPVAPVQPVEWTPGANVWKDWCTEYFGPDADDAYLAKAVFNLPTMAQKFGTQVAPVQADLQTICNWLCLEPGASNSETMEKIRSQLCKDTAHRIAQKSRNVAPVQARELPPLAIALRALEMLAQTPGCGCSFPCRCNGDEWTRAELEGRMDVAETALNDIRAALASTSAPTLIGAKVSMDVSTGDHDAEHRIYGRVEEVMNGAVGEVVFLAVEESRNFTSAQQADAQARDAARLQWMCQHGANIAWTMDGELCNVWLPAERDGTEACPTEGWPQKRYAHWRHAIDAAIAAKEAK